MIQEKSCGAVVYRMEQGVPLLLVEYMTLGHVSIPKGHVEPGETEEETARREIWEEVGLEVRLDTGFRRTITYSPREGVSKDVVFFLGEYVSGEIAVQLSEVQRAAFLPQAEAEAAVTFDSDRETLRLACDYLRKQREAEA